MKDSSRSRKKVDFRESEKRGNETSNGVVRGNQQVSVHELWKKQQKHEDARNMHRTKNVVGTFGKLKKRQLGRHELVRRMDRQGEVLIWYRKSSGYARQRMGPKVMNCC